jgi:hypothetical protein
VGGAGFTIHGPAGNQKRDKSFGQPDIDPGSEIRLFSGDGAGDEGSCADISPRPEIPVKGVARSIVSRM